MKLDELDHKLIELLQIDGRSSNANLARQVGVSEGTVRRRLQRLFDNKLIRVLAIPDVSKLGLTTSALIGIQVLPNMIEDVANKSEMLLTNCQRFERRNSWG